PRQSHPRRTRRLILHLLHAFFSVTSRHRRRLPGTLWSEAHMLTTTLATVFVWSTLTQNSVSRPEAPRAALQSAPATPAGTPGQQVIRLLKDGNVRFELLDDRGKRHKASLVQVQGDDVTLRTRGELLVVPADQLQRADRSGDAPWDGALIGLAAGGALLTGTVAPDPGGWTAHDT